MASSAKDIQLRELKDTVSQLKTMISEQTELIKSLRLIIDEKSSHEKALQEQVDYLTKKLFGSSSERRSDDIPGQQNLFDEAEKEQDPSLPEEETVIKEHTRKKKATHEDLFKGLKVEKVVIPLPEEEQICPVCGKGSAANKKYVVRIHRGGRGHGVFLVGADGDLHHAPLQQL